MKNKIEIPDALVLVQDGITIARIPATLDLSNVPEFYLQFIKLHRTVLHIPSFDRLMDAQIRSRAYALKISKYNSLPRWRKLFSRRPSF